LFNPVGTSLGGCIAEAGEGCALVNGSALTTAGTYALKTTNATHTFNTTLSVQLLLTNQPLAIAGDLLRRGSGLF